MTIPRDRTQGSIIRAVNLGTVQFGPELLVRRQRMSAVHQIKSNTHKRMGISILLGYIPRNALTDFSMAKSSLEWRLVGL